MVAIDVTERVSGALPRVAMHRPGSVRQPEQAEHAGKPGGHGAGEGHTADSVGELVATEEPGESDRLRVASPIPAEVPNMTSMIACPSGFGDESPLRRRQLRTACLIASTPRPYRNIDQIATIRTTRSWRADEAAFRSRRSSRWGGPSACCARCSATRRREGRRDARAGRRQEPECRP
jgi:hypothetical protein